MDRLSLDLNALALKDGLLSLEWYDLDRVMKEGIFDWDKVVKSSHPWNCWYGLPCTYNVYVKDGVALREEQPHNYWEPSRDDLPDLNGKGCQKGCGHVHQLYEAQRILHPLKRIGERGGGKWKRVTWDEALDDIAAKMFKSMVEDGIHSVSSLGGSYNFGPLHGAWGKYFGQPIARESTDHHPGFYEVCGKIFTGDSVDHFFDCDMVIIWGGNPAYTWIPLFHYFVEARYRGAKLVCISPDYSASSLPCDLWIPVKPGSDSALALAMMQVIIEEGLQDLPFILEQTDLPLLVSKDNGKFLRERDVKKGGRDYVYFMWDQRGNRLREAPLARLALGDLQPALEGEWEIKTQKERVKVTTVYSSFKKKLFAEHRPEQASPVCGVAPDLIRRFARDFARAKVVSAPSQSNFSKYYHGNIMERACLLLFALTGHVGKRGNWHGFLGLLQPDAAYGTLRPQSFRDVAALLVNHPDYPIWKERGFTDQAVVMEAAARAARTGAIQNTALTTFFHGGYTETQDKFSWDPHMKRPLGEYLQEGLEAGDIRKTVIPSPDRPIRVILNWGANVLRRARAAQHLTDVLFPKVDLIVTLDLRWTSSCSYSDYVLPVPSSGYESGMAMNLSTWISGPGPTFSYPGRAVDFPGESKTDWWIVVELYERIARMAREQGVKSVRNREFGGEIQIDNMDEYITSGGLYPADGGDWSMTMDIFANAYNLESNDLEEFESKGWVRASETGYYPSSVELAADLVPGDPIVGNQWHTERKEPWPTHTGRMQFYIDHDWYLELGEEFPWHKDSIRAGGNYPIQFLTGHARWSIHSMQSDSPLMLMLQRGEPLMFLNDRDASARGIVDGDKVEIFNDIGRSELHVAISGRVPPGVAFVYHHWDNSQFKGWRQFQHVMPAPFNPISFAPAGDDYPNVRMGPIAGSPGMVDRDTRIEIRKVQ